MLPPPPHRIPPWFIVMEVLITAPLLHVRDSQYPIYYQWWGSYCQLASRCFYSKNFILASAFFGPHFVPTDIDKVPWKTYSETVIQIKAVNWDELTEITPIWEWEREVRLGRERRREKRMDKWQEFFAISSGQDTPN